MVERGVAEALLGCGIRALTPCKASGNSRVYQLEDEQGVFYALKAYPPLDRDPRDRLGVEYLALSFLSGHSKLTVPRPHAMDRAGLLAIYSWIEGERPSPSAAVIDAMLGFMKVAYSLRDNPGAGILPLASECCLSGAEILRQVRKRLDRLKMQKEEVDLQNFLEKSFEPLLVEMDLEDIALDKHLRCMNPGDFGAHNMLASGNLFSFVDMEYFGWDDPVKQVCDVLWHPAMSLDQSLSARFLMGAKKIYSISDTGFSDRVQRYFRAYGLRWIMIVLNEFIPERWALRAHAGVIDGRESKARQLLKAQSMVAGMNQRCDFISYLLKQKPA